MAELLRVDYEDLEQIRTSLQGVAQNVANCNQQIGRCLQALQGGSWVGDGASRFYDEMGGQVNPALHRLHQALENSANVIQELGQAFQAAEHQARGCFAGDGAGSSTYA
jgi:WXG100 family type VII secretion target